MIKRVRMLTLEYFGESDDRLRLELNDDNFTADSVQQKRCRLDVDVTLSMLFIFSRLKLAFSASSWCRRYIIIVSSC